MKHKKMNWKEMSIGLCLVALLAWFTFHVLLSGHSAQTLGSTFMRADIRFVAIGFACMFLFVNCEAANIRLLMGTFGKKVPYWRSLSYAFTDFYFSAITPSATGGQPMQLYYMVRDGFGAAHSSFSLLATAAVYQMTVLVYGCVMVGANLPFVMGESRVMRLLLVFGIYSAVQLTALYLVPYWACRALGLSVQIKDVLALQAILSLAVTAVPLPGSVGGFRGEFSCAVPYPSGDRPELFRDALKQGNQLLRNAVHKRAGNRLPAVCEKGKICLAGVNVSAIDQNRGLPMESGSPLMPFQFTSLHPA